jgi:hypothetical protein
VIGVVSGIYKQSKCHCIDALTSSVFQMDMLAN